MLNNGESIVNPLFGDTFCCQIQSNFVLLEYLGYC